MVWRKKIGIFPWHNNVSLNFLESGKPFFDALLGQIQSAQSSIHFHVYIFANDHTGKTIYEALLAAAKRGVKIILRIDAYGSNNFPIEWEHALKQRGVDIQLFSKFKLAFKYHIGVRLHHKIFVFDEQVAMLGGINISDNYSHWGEEGNWLDYGISVEGSVVKDLLQICKGIEDGLNLFQPKTTSLEEGKKTVQTDKQIRILQNYWFKAKFGISRQYRQKIRNAQHNILLISSYFLPSPALKRLLKKAAKRGVYVELVLGAKSDVKMVQYATQYFYEDLLKADVVIREWQASVLHAKIAFADDNWMCIGSYNLNHLSDFGSVECNAEILDPLFISQAKNQITYSLKNNSHIVHPASYHQKIQLYHSVRNFLSYQLVSIGMKILFYLQKSGK